MKENILLQLETAWQLYLYHVNDLEDKEAMWSLSPSSLKIREKDGAWIIDWPETESYDIGPTSIAWTLWHIMYWWSTALDFNFSEGTLKKEDVVWPGSVERAKEKILLLHDKWVEKINNMSDEDMISEEYACWPFAGKSFIDIALWLNVELMKNAAEIGSGRFLFAASK